MRPRIIDDKIGKWFISYKNVVNVFVTYVFIQKGNFHIHLCIHIFYLISFFDMNCCCCQKNRRLTLDSFA